MLQSSMRSKSILILILQFKSEIVGKLLDRKGEGKQMFSTCDNFCKYI